MTCEKFPHGFCALAIGYLGVILGVGARIAFSVFFSDHGCAMAAFLGLTGII